MTNRTIKWTALAAALVIGLSCTACGASSKSDASVVRNGYDSYLEDSYNGAYAEDLEASMDENGYSVQETAKSNAQGGASSAASGEAMEEKIIRTAHVEMESHDAQQCYDTLLSFVKENGGSELSVNKTHEQYGTYGYFNISATLKIAPDKLDEFLKLAEKTDKVSSTEVSSDDVTKEYYDIKLRLESKKAALENYYKLLKEAKTVQDSLEVQRYITDLTAEIESMEGMLRYYDAKVDLSTIYLNVRQTDKLPAEIDDEFHWDSLSPSDVGKLMKNGFLSVVNFLWMLLVWAVIAVVVLSPVLLIAGVIVLLVLRHYRKHPRAKKQQDYTSPASYTQSGDRQ